MSPLASQASFLTILDKVKYTLDPEEASTYNRYADSVGHTYTSVDLVRINPLGGIISDGVLSIDLADYDCTLQCDYQDGEYLSDYYSWYGVPLAEEKSDPACPTGEFFYFRDENGHHGHFAADDQRFEFMPLGGDLAVLLSLATADDRKLVCGVDSLNMLTSPRATKDENSDRLNKADCPEDAVVRLLILFTDNADLENPDIEALARLCFAEARQAIRNSRVYALNLSLELAGIDFVQLNETGRARDDIENWNNEPLVLNARNEAAADLVMILTGNLYGGTAGIAPIGILPERFVGLSTQGPAVTEKTFVHELGHLFGGLHEIGNTAVSFERGLTF